jgi:hypothetical protein
LKDVSLDLDEDDVSEKKSPAKLKNLRKGMSRSTKDLKRAGTTKLDSDDEDEDKDDEDSLDDAGS